MNRLAPAILAVTIILAGCRDQVQPPKPQPPVQPKHVQTTQPAPVKVQTTQPAVPPKVEPTHAAVTPPAAPPPAADPIIARVNGVSIARDQVITPLLEGHGLDMLTRVVLLELAKNEAAKLNLVATPEEVRAERTRALEQLAKEQNSKLLDQIKDAEAAHRDEEALRLRSQLEKDNMQLLEKVLQEQKLSQAEFMIAMETNANLHKVVNHQIQGKLTDENLHQAFNALYGEKVRVRHIQCANLQEIAEAQRRLEAGQTFEKVAEDLSRNPNSRLHGGELPAFTRETPGLSEAFKQVAFSLKEAGEVSEPVSADGAYHLLKLIEKIPPNPKTQKFEDVKDSVAKYLMQRWADEGSNQLRASLGQIALKTIQINDPILAQQFKDLTLKRQAEMRDRDQINRQLEREREATTQMSPTTAPNTMPLQGATEPPRPPATRSGSDTPDASMQSTQPTTQPK